MTLRLMARAGWLLIAAGLAVVALSCGPTTASAVCKSICAGCCDRVGECQSGDRQTACGVMAASCRTCASGEVCTSGTCGPPKTGGRCGTVSCPAATVCDPADGSCKCGSGDAGHACLATEHCDSATNTCVTTLASCGPANCAGCCSSDVCQPGSFGSECGRSGQACFSCGGGSSCQQGVCQFGGKDGGFCGSMSCGGCCLNDLCFAGNTPSLCGSGGQSCQMCPGGFSCGSGFCQGGGFDGGFCGPGNCFGCCFGGNCQPGNTQFLCGTFGAACFGCAVACIQGTCASGADAGGCGPGTCSGCCQNGFCNQGRSDFACGTMGQACFQCSFGFSCPQGFCQFTGFDAGTDAGSGGDAGRGADAGSSSDGGSSGDGGIDGG